MPNSEVHYYPDGDIIIDVEETRFKVHSTILILASKQFATIINSNIKETPTTDVPNTIAQFELKDKLAVQVEDLLSMLYPQTNVVLTWDNVEYIGGMAHEYKIAGVISRIREFMNPRWDKQPLRALLLAEQLELVDEYREASRMVINELLTMQTEPLFDRLSDTTKLKLHRQYTLFAAEMKTRMAPGPFANEHVRHGRHDRSKLPNGFLLNPLVLGYDLSYSQFGYSSPSFVWQSIISVGCPTCKETIWKAFNGIPFLSTPPLGSPLGEEYFLSIELDLH